jgi:hypothetical protein
MLPVVHQLSGRVVDGREVIGVECVSQLVVARLRGLADVLMSFQTRSDPLDLGAGVTGGTPQRPFILLLRGRFPD